MKIGFDAQLLTGRQRTGIGWCADNIIKEISKRPDCQCELNYFYLCRNGKALDEYEKYGARKHPCYWFVGSVFYRLSRMFPLPYHLFFGRHQKITQFMNYEVPAGVKGKTVTLVCDMAFKTCPGTVNEATRNWLEKILPVSCERADAIVTISEFSKREIMEYLHIPENKITVMPCGVDLQTYHPSYSKEIISKSKDKYHIHGEYFLYLGTLEPRKNIVRIVEAYSIFAKKHIEDDVPQLVLAGGKGWYYDGIFEKVRELKLEDRIIFTGYVDEQDVAPLMSGALAFVFPSLYEGFGMPPLEAMACGTPVISANVTSLPEVVGDAGILIDPDSTEQLAKAMEQLHEDDVLRENLRRQGVARAKKFTWARSVDILVKLYEKLIK